MLLFKDISVYGPFGYYESPLRRIAMNLTPDDPVLVLQDRDNINLSKNVVFSHKNLLNMGLFFGKEVNISEGDRIIIPQYQNTSFGFILANFSSFVNGATIILPSQHFSPKITLTALSKDKGTHIFATEEDYRKILDTSNQAEFLDLDFSTLKCAIIGI
jgi:fatty-acyl-CoA synthase